MTEPIQHTEIDRSHPGRMERPYISIVFQHGPVDTAGVNGCRIEDVLEAVAEKLRLYESGPLRCLENSETLRYLDLAKQAQERRRELRVQQGVFNTQKAHASIFKERTEDAVDDFSATGS